MILNEGGNIFQGTSDFDQKLIPDMMKQVNSIMSKTGVKALPIGSGATPPCTYSIMYGRAQAG